MKPRISVVTLGVANLERAVGFYRDGLGCFRRTDDGGRRGCLFLRG
jgi:catechol 2,3-dioxygenase-like lactoylglutathione lyase family enzyme